MFFFSFFLLCCLLKLLFLFLFSRAWAPTLLVLSNSGLIYSTWWCLQRGLLHEAFGYMFLAVASMVMHSYRDGRSWQRPKRMTLRLVGFLMRLDYMAVFHISAMVGIYLSDYDQSVVVLSRPFLYLSSLTMAAALGFTTSHDRVHLNGIVFLLFGVVAAVPCLLTEMGVYNYAMLWLVIGLQFFAYTFIGYIQYKVPYWVSVATSDHCNPALALTKQTMLTCSWGTPCGMCWAVWQRSCACLCVWSHLPLLSVYSQLLKK